MGRQTSLDGSAKNLTLSDKSSLLAEAANNLELVDNPLYEFANEVGPEVMDRLCSIMSGEKIHIPDPKNFWSKLNRQLHRSEMVKKVCHLIDEKKYTMASAINHVSAEYGVGFSWLKSTYLGDRHDG